VAMFGTKMIKPKPRWQEANIDSGPHQG
jgi:hypothetical protein